MLRLQLGIIAAQQPANRCRVLVCVGEHTGYADCVEQGRGWVAAVRTIDRHEKSALNRHGHISVHGLIRGIHSSTYEL